MAKKLKYPFEITKKQKDMRDENSPATPPFKPRDRKAGEKYVTKKPKKA